ncbi:MAG: hypothetical protein LJE89_12240 [Deltaproteobacteria bacterium]|nr:hypothetical protein [Deltaproteobacteria bacterium]
MLLPFLACCLLSAVYYFLLDLLDSQSAKVYKKADLALIFHELLSRDREDGRATRQSQGVGAEAYLNGTSQGSKPEDAGKDGHIRGRSGLSMEYEG